MSATKALTVAIVTVALLLTLGTTGAVAQETRATMSAPTSASISASASVPHAGAAPPAREPAATALAQVQARLQTALVVRADFEQRKQLKGFRNPLISRGNFVHVRARGLIWRTQEPFASTLIAVPGRTLRNLDATDKPLPVSDAQAARVLSEMLFSLVSADFERLAPHFEITATLDANKNWRLVLTPKRAALAQALTRVEIQGDNFVRQVKVDEATGDTTWLRFSQHTSAATLSRDEEKRFE